ncbi:MAG TPA: hypothetical protein VFV08_11295 [Puia sp.]|nr:hypothetical protein [Puia sp.]
MKNKMNVLVLALEITAISIIHAVKIKQSEKITQTTIASQNNFIKQDATRIKTPYLFTKIYK